MTEKRRTPDLVIGTRDLEGAAVRPRSIEGAMAARTCPRPAESDHSPAGRMEFRHLAALAAVAREKSFVDAAFELGYVQSAVSQQIAQLEKAIGTRLVDRRRGASPVALTQAGELLLQHFEKICAELERARLDLDAVRCGRAGVLRVGLWDSLATRLMPAILGSLSQRLPDLEVQTECSRSTNALTDQVQSGQLDLAFGVLPLPVGPLNFEPLLADPSVLVVPASWALAHDEQAPSAEALADLPLIETGDEDALAAKFKAMGLKPNYVARAEGDGAVQALVAAGLGAAVVPRMAVDFRQERITALDLDLLPPRQIVLCWRAGVARTVAVDGFIEAASRVCGVKLRRGQPATPQQKAA